MPRLPPLTAMLAAVLVGALPPFLAAAPPDRLSLCYDFGCKSSADVELDALDWELLEPLFAGVEDAPAEREAVAAAVALFERLLGARSGTAGDRGGNFRGSGLPGQMDCIDESTNTTAYLALLTARGLLRWHRVGDRAHRAPWLFDDHWTATLRETRTGRAWAVDSWYLDNGQRPYLQPLQDWLTKAALPPHPDRGAAGP